MRWIALCIGLVFAGFTLREAASKGVVGQSVTPTVASLTATIPGESTQAVLPRRSEIAPDRGVAVDEPPASFQLASLDPTGSIADRRRQRNPRPDEPFGLPAFRAPEGPLWTKWRTVEAQMQSDAGILTACRKVSDQCPAAARRLLEIIETARAHEGRARIGQVNRAINLAIRPTSDQKQFGTGDVWTSPLATLATTRGDCEDYAIAKYLALREAGIAGEDMRLIIAEDTVAREDHAVLAVRLGESWLILDNRNHTLADAAEVRHLRPLYALDQVGVRRFAPTYAQRPAAPGDGKSGSARDERLTDAQSDNGMPARRRGSRFP